jgi:hypothetical protein
MMPKKWCLSSNQTDNSSRKRLYQASGDTWSEAPPVSNCDEGFINPGYLRMLFVLFDASLALHHPGDEIQGHPHFLAVGRLCPSVNSQSCAYLVFIHVSLSMQANANII